MPHVVVALTNKFSIFSSEWYETFIIWCLLEFHVQNELHLLNYMLRNCCNVRMNTTECMKGIYMCTNNLLEIATTSAWTSHVKILMLSQNRDKPHSQYWELGTVESFGCFFFGLMEGVCWVVHACILLFSEKLDHNCWTHIFFVIWKWVSVVIWPGSKILQVPKLALGHCRRRFSQSHSDHYINFDSVS